MTMVAGGVGLAAQRQWLRDGMPHKLNDDRRHKFTKAKYRMTNWPDYDAALGWCASRAAVILYGSVLHAKLTPWIGSVELGANQASIGSGMTKIGMVRLAKYTPFGVMWRRCSGQT